MNDVIELAIDFGVIGFGLAILAAIVATPLALIVLLVDGIAGKWMTARVRCLLWMVVAMRLVLPIAPESPVSAGHLWHLVNWSERAAPVNYVASNLSDLLAQVFAVGSADDSPQPESTNSSVAGVVIGEPGNISQHLAATTSEEWEQLWLARDATLEFHAIGGVKSTSAQWRWKDVLLVSTVSIWLLGVVIVLQRATVASLRFGRNLRSIPEVDDRSTLSIVLHACDQIGVRCPRVKRVPGLPVPALFGVWRLTLCLPEDSQQQIGDDQLRMIALHEAMHIRRGDGIIAWFLTVVRAIHWFNPIAWFTVKQVETYRELACDDAVRKFTRPQERGTYADLLLRFAAGHPTASLGLLGLWFARPAKRNSWVLARRIKAFTAKSENPRRFPLLISFVLMLLIAVVGLTDATNTRVIEVTEKPVLPAFSESDSEKVETREYDLTEALRKVDDVPPNMNASDWLLSWAKAGVQSNQMPLIETAEGDPGRVSISMPRSGHSFFESMLTAVCRVGHVRQVVVTTRAMGSEHAEELIDADWLDAIEYAVSEPVSSSQWAKNVARENGKELSLSMEAVSFEYAPYTAFIVDDERMARLIHSHASREDASIVNTPKITLFSGQSASLEVASLSRFAYGVETVVVKDTTALQANTTVIPEGLKLDLQVVVLDNETIDLRYRLTISSIDGVTKTTLPGSNVTVQTPKATRHTVNVHCQLDHGKTLIVAPVVGQRSDGKKTHYYVVSAEQVFQEQRVVN